MVEKICQSCAMSLNEERYFGTNNDGSQNTDYCIFCFKNGDFTYEISMNEMVEKGISKITSNSSDGNNTISN